MMNRENETAPVRPIAPGLLADTERLAARAGFASASDAADAFGYPAATEHHEAHLTLRSWLMARLREPLTLADSEAMATARELGEF